MSHRTITLDGNSTDEWTFKNADTQYLTHGLHPYPARMIPQLAHKLIDKYSEQECWVLDPFCGSGSVLVESRLRNRNSIGNELNPLGVILSKVKTTPLDKEELMRVSKAVLNDAQKKIASARNKRSKTISMEKWMDSQGSSMECYMAETVKGVPAFPNIHLWFKDDVISELAAVRSSVESLDCEETYLNFLRVCLSYTAMKCSNADFEGHQSHPSRYKSEKLKAYTPNVWSTFREKLRDSVGRLIDFSGKVSNNSVKSIVLSGDARTLDLTDVAPSSGVDLVVTSPPYGEEHNTIGYHRWSRLMCFWIGFSPEEMRASEKLTLGAKSCADATISSNTANYFVNLVASKAKGKARAARLAAFFKDYQISTERMAQWLKPGGIAAIVVGNRLVTGHRIAMDKVTIELAEQYGLKELETFYRDIPNTVMPKRIPEGETIAKESIMILKKT